MCVHPDPQTDLQTCPLSRRSRYVHVCVCVCVEEEDGSRQLTSLWGKEFVPFQGPWTGQLSPAPAQFHPSALRAVCVCVLCVCVCVCACMEEITHSENRVENLVRASNRAFSSYNHNFLDLAAISTYIV